MIKKLVLALLLLFPFILMAQNKNAGEDKKAEKSTFQKAKEARIKENAEKAPINLYRIITIDRDTTFVDTSLTIQKEYKFNYLRKDNFGLLPFANEGQTYNTLDFELTNFSPYPEFGFKAKHFNYLETRDIKYYSVATPFTELYFKTVMEQGQMLDAFLTLNTSERLNFSIAYKGLRSVGKYVNQVSSNGNFRFTTSYKSHKNRYLLNAHFTAQDLYNDENGGILSTANFESGEDPFTERARLDVYFDDASSMLKGNRYFIDHSFRINKEGGDNNLRITHQMNFENKSFEFSQPTISTRFGPSYVSSNIKDKTRYNRFYNKVGATYENSTIGEVQFFIEDFRYNYYYNRAIFDGTGLIIPNKLGTTINSVGGQYRYQKNNWNGKFLYSRSISTQAISNLDASVVYRLDDKNHFTFRYQNISKLPDNNYSLYQSGYTEYNWSNSFKNQKINSLHVEAKTQWATASLELTTLKDYLYFQNTQSRIDSLIVKPFQYNKVINYMAFKVAKEFKFGKWALDNTVLYQKTDQSDKILNVPQLVTRNTIYYSDFIFKKAMYIQTGITFSYFSKYYANDYNPLIGEFYVQQEKQIGDFPMFDFFINAEVGQTRIYLKAEHFNSALSGYDFYAAPNYPYRDFIVRFGLVWNFFK